MTARRRMFLTVLLASSAMPRLLYAQARRAVILIGWLDFGSREAGSASLAAFRENLAALGWKEGAHVAIEARWADGRADRVDALAAELAATRPAVMVATSLRTAAALTRAAPRTPIVQTGGADPVVPGLAASHARPGGMLTGMSSITVELSEKYLELLLAAAPKLRRVAVLVDANAVNLESQIKAVQRAAARHALNARVLEVAKAEDIQAVLANAAKLGVEALAVVQSPMLAFERQRIVSLALAHRWPVIGGGPVWADAGALLSYGTERSHNYRRAAYYVDRILKGTRPGDLPIERPTKFQLVINAKTAKTLGLAIPQELLLRANRVIE